MNEFEIDKQQVRRAFSRAAQDYDAAAVLQREVCTRMLDKLDCVKLKPARVLDIGSGTGWGTRQLGERYPQAEVTALDIAIGMLQHARGTSGWWKKLFAGLLAGVLAPLSVEYLMDKQYIHPLEPQKWVW